MGGPSLYVVAGEPSGDAHAAGLLAELAGLRPGLRARGLGGRRLEAGGMQLRRDLASEAVMGLFPVLRALPRLRRIFHDALRELRSDPPDALLLVDYPGFNLQLARRAHGLGFPVLYYISPQVWAWRRGRIAQIRECVDLMVTILPFEADVYRDSGVHAVYAGHPMADALAAEPADPARVAALRAKGGPLIGIFPGSRRHVVASLLPVLMDAFRRVRAHPAGKDARAVVAFAHPGHVALLRSADSRGLPVQHTAGEARAVMAAMDFALSTSGTTTLEIAAHGKPFVLGYRVSPLTYLLGRLLIAVPHIGLVNLVAGRRVVPEHVGVRSFASAMASDLITLLSDPAAREAQAAGLREVGLALHRPGSYRRAAEALLPFLPPHPS
jgi:lipid-A-disaccharide synthase